MVETGSDWCVEAVWVGDFAEGNFDPEFFERHEDEIVHTLRGQYETQVKEVSK